MSNNGQAYGPEKVQPTLAYGTANGYVNGKQVPPNARVSMGPIGPPPGMPPKRKPVKRMAVGSYVPGEMPTRPMTSNATPPRQSLDQQRPTPPNPNSLRPVNSSSAAPNDHRWSPPVDYQQQQQYARKVPYPDDPEDRRMSQPYEPPPRPPALRQSYHSSTENLRQGQQLRYPQQTVPLPQALTSIPVHTAPAVPPHVHQFQDDELSPAVSRTSTNQSFHTANNAFNSINSIPQLAPPAPPPLAPQPQLRQRLDSVHSTASVQSTSQPLYMTVPSSQDPQFSAAQGGLHHQHSISQSSVYSAGSKYSRRSNSVSGPNVELGIGTGSAYVKELRRRQATTWTDVPSKVWGLPIALSGKTTSSSVLGPTKGFQRRAMDIRHTHLQPRLLAGEVEDEDDDDMQSPGGTTSNSGAVSQGQSPLDQSSVRSTESMEKLGDKSRSRASSTSSTKSVEEEVGKIKLFVANPDSDSD